LKLGIIGFGYTGQQHARAVSEITGITLVAIAEPDARKRARATVPAFSDYHLLLSDPSIDAVSICLPHFLHERVATDSLLAAKHVLIEKPLAMTVTGGERLCTLARARSRVLMVEMTHRFMPPVVHARNHVKAGAIGEILAVAEVLVEGLGIWGSLPTWMFDRSAAGGGVGLTSGIHLLDHVAWLADQALSLDCARFLRSNSSGDVENVASYSLKLGSGAPVQIMLAWRSQSDSLEGELSVYGTKGTVTIQVWRGWTLSNQDGHRVEVNFDEQLTIPERARVGMKGALTEFAAAVHEERDPVPKAEESLVSQRLIEQAYERMS
jgi:UDP-N-acetyl-2-amino-2-deoxyglucuronate dehydrogenase